MKTLADFKRRVQLGVKVETIHARLGSFGIRSISKVQSNSFAMLTEQFPTEGKLPEGPKDSWCEFPKSKYIEFPDENTAEIYWDLNGKREKILTYKFVDNNFTDEQK